MDSDSLLYQAAQCQKKVDDIKYEITGTIDTETSQISKNTDDPFAGLSVDDLKRQLKQANSMVSFLSGEQQKINNRSDMVEYHNTWLSSKDYSITYKKMTVVLLDDLRVMIGKASPDGNFYAMYQLQPCDTYVGSEHIVYWKHAKSPLDKTHD